MKIAVDFDDVVVETTRAFLTLWNARFTEQIAYNDITEWNIPKVFGLEVQTVKDIYALVDYTEVEEVTMALDSIRAWKAAGHDVAIVSYNPDYKAIRKYMTRNGLASVPVFAGVGHKAGFCRDNEYDVLIDDNLGYLKAASTVEVYNIRFNRPWNQGFDGRIGDQFAYGANDWAQVNYRVRQIHEELVNKAFRNTVGVEVVGLAVPKEWNKFCPEGVEEVVVNANGAKQSKIVGRFDLLPGRAVAEVAEVLEIGAEKYGIDNWKGLSVGEITNHTLRHLMNFQANDDIEELSHAACRCLMALEIRLEQE